LIAAFDNRFDRIICADLSRISRDQADTTELKAWFEDNTKQMCLPRLDIDREKRALADLSPPRQYLGNPFAFRQKHLKTAGLEPRSQGCFTQLRNTMKSYTITAHWDPDGKRWYRTCEIEYDFPAMVRILGQKK
jgi:hypothetical protein